ncbi:MAG: DUF6089 family protein [Bacteroidales bacterium]|nr:DUF6089 family protein [Bacteroidales bacterium]
MKKIFFACLLVMAMMMNAFAQKSEIGAFVGTSFYIGDLSHSTIFSECDIAGGIVYRYNFTPRWALKANIMFAKVHASDAKSNGKFERNLSFKSPITELSVQAELNFLKLYNQKGYNCFSPYIFAGVAVFSFNPQAEYNGKTYDLQPLGTEGQGLVKGKEGYPLCSFAVPFGIGLKVNIGRYVSIGAEWGMRFTCTDYLDDISTVYYDNDDLRYRRGDIMADLADRSPEIGGPLHEGGSQRGNFNTTDFYSFCGGTITFKIGNEDRICDIKHKLSSRHKLGRKR